MRSLVGNYLAGDLPPNLDDREVIRRVTACLVPRYRRAFSHREARHRIIKSALFTYQRHRKHLKAD